MIMRECFACGREMYSSDTINWWRCENPDCGTLISPEDNQPAEPPRVMFKKHKRKTASAGTETAACMAAKI